jgi:hypothetical protein
LRLIYTFEAVWKACQQLLAEREDIEVGSPNTTIRAVRRLGWLFDRDAEAAMRITGIAISRFTCIAAGSGKRSTSVSAPMPRCSGVGSTPCGG